MSFLPWLGIWIPQVRKDPPWPLQKKGKMASPLWQRRIEGQWGSLKCQEMMRRPSFCHSEGLKSAEKSLNTRCFLSEPYYI